MELEDHRVTPRQLRIAAWWIVAFLAACVVIAAFGMARGW